MSSTYTQEKNIQWIIQVLESKSSLILIKTAAISPCSFLFISSSSPIILLVTQFLRLYYEELFIVMHGRNKANVLVFFKIFKLN